MDKKNKITLLQDMIKIDSTNGNEKEVANYLEQVFVTYGIESK